MFDLIIHEFYLIHYLQGNCAINKFWTDSYILADNIAFLVTIIVAFALKISTRFFEKLVFNFLKKTKCIDSDIIEERYGKCLYLQKKR